MSDKSGREASTPGAEGGGDEVESLSRCTRESVGSKASTCVEHSCSGWLPDDENRHTAVVLVV